MFIVIFIFLSVLSFSSSIIVDGYLDPEYGTINSTVTHYTATGYVYGSFQDPGSVTQGPTYQIFQYVDDNYVYAFMRTNVTANGGSRTDISFEGIGNTAVEANVYYNTRPAQNPGLLPLATCGPDTPTPFLGFEIGVYLNTTNVYKTNIFKPGCNGNAGSTCLGNAVTDILVGSREVKGGDCTIEYAIPLHWFLNGYYYASNGELVTFESLAGFCAPAELRLSESQTFNGAVAGGAANYGPDELGVQTVYSAPEYFGTNCTGVGALSCPDYFTVSNDGNVDLAIRGTDGTLFACPDSDGNLISICQLIQSNSGSSSTNMVKRVEMDDANLMRISALEERINGLEAQLRELKEK